MNTANGALATLAIWALCASAAFADETLDAAAATGTAPRRTDLSGHLALSASAGQFGIDPLFGLHVTYFPTSRFGMEATLAHNPSSDTHAALHHVSGNVQLRRSGVLRPYAIVGLGTIQVFPGTAINAETVTKLLLSAGGGVQFHARDDIALRIESRSAGIVDSQEDHRGLLGFLQWNVGVTFYRSLSAPGSFDTGGAQ